jgi:hypothetical protein
VLLQVRTFETLKYLICPFKNYKHMSRQENETISAVFFPSPDWTGESELCKYSIFIYKAAHVLKVILPLLDIFGGKEDQQQRWRGEREWSLWNKKSQRVCAQPTQLYVCLMNGLWFWKKPNVSIQHRSRLWALTLLHKCLKAVVSFFLPLNVIWQLLFLWGGTGLQS